MCAQDSSSPLYLPTYCNVSAPDRGPAPRAPMVDGHVDSRHFIDCPCDPGHLSTEGLKRLGGRLAQAVLHGRQAPSSNIW